MRLSLSTGYGQERVTPSAVALGFELPSRRVYLYEAHTQRAAIEVPLFMKTGCEHDREINFRKQVLVDLVLCTLPCLRGLAIAIALVIAVPWHY